MNIVQMKKYRCCRTEIQTFYLKAGGHFMETETKRLKESHNISNYFSTD